MHKRDEKGRNLIPFPNKKYNLIYADPPWSYRTWNAKSGHKSASAHYKTMDIKDYCDVVNKVKKKNIKPENIGEIILSQIPGISSITSRAILNEYGSLYNLLISLKKDNKCLNKMTIKMGEKERKISNTSIRNIYNYLLYQKNNEIEINTK